MKRTSFQIHVTAQQNKLNIWHWKRAMQIQTEHQIIWFEKLQYQSDLSEVSPPSSTLYGGTSNQNVHR